MVTVTDQLGSVLAGRYRLGARIGVGGMAEVYAATDLRLHRPVAVKLLRHDVAADAVSRARLEREARSAGRLTHPNVVAVYDVGHEDGRSYLVMELVEGGSLAQRLSHGPLEPETARAVALDVLGGLGAAHRAGLMHRDIKPANILFTADGTAKLADFGIAKARPSPSTDADARTETYGTVTGQAEPELPDTDLPDSDLTRPNIVMGTARYLAPERALGADATVQSDIWSLGLVLYEAVGGSQQQGGRPGQEAHLDPNIERVITRAMHPRPESRFASAAAMAEALTPRTSDAWVVTEPVERDAATQPLAVVPETQPLASAPRAPRRAIPLSWRVGAVMVLVAGLALIASLAGGAGGVGAGDGWAGRAAPVMVGSTIAQPEITEAVMCTTPKQKHHSGGDHKDKPPAPCAPTAGGDQGPGSGGAGSGAGGSGSSGPGGGSGSSND